MPYDDDDDRYEELEDLKANFESYIGQVQGALLINYIYLFGASLAMVISYSNNGSILWAIVHGLLSWGYVIYYAIFK